MLCEVLGPFSLIRYMSQCGGGFWGGCFWVGGVLKLVDANNASTYLHVFYMRTLKNESPF